jgi:hypothetical protein
LKLDILLINISTFSSLSFEIIMKAEDLRTSATHLKPPVKNLAARQRAMSCELKRPIFISSLSNPIKRPKNPASLF